MSASGFAKSLSDIPAHLESRSDVQPADTNTSGPSRLPELPVEIWERIIDNIPSFKDMLMLDELASIQACCLVRRAWIPRCRLYLCRTVHLDSRGMLQAASTFFHSSPFHAEKVRGLVVIGRGADQTWISNIPLRLPKLVNLERISFRDVDLSQQHPSFPQLLSRHRWPKTNQDFVLHVDNTEAELDRQSMQVAAIAVALRATLVECRELEIHSCEEITRLNGWPRSLTSLMVLRVGGEPDFLAEALCKWEFPARTCDIVVQHSSLQDAITDMACQTQVVWSEISRVLKLFKTAYVPILSLQARMWSIVVEKTNDNVLRISLSEATTDDMLHYISYVLPILIQRSSWPTEFKFDNQAFMLVLRNAQLWCSIDEALCRSSVPSVWMRTDSAQSLLQDETLTPYACINDIVARCLSKCVARGKAKFTCTKQDCVIHLLK